MSGSPNLKFNLPFSLGIPDSPPSDIPPELRSIFVIVYNSFLQLQQAMHQYLGLGQQLQTLWSQLRFDQTLHQFSPNRLYLPASEPIAYGLAVNVFDSGGGVMKLRLANATNNTKPAHGFCTTIGGIATDAYGEIICNFGLLTGVVGLTKGSRYFLSTAGGLITAVAPAAAGNIEQCLAWAIDTNALLFNFGFSFVQH